MLTSSFMPQTSRTGHHPDPRRLGPGPFIDEETLCHHTQDRAGSVAI